MNNIIIMNPADINSLEQCLALRKEEDQLVLGWYIEGELNYPLEIQELKKFEDREKIFLEFLHEIENLEKLDEEDVYVEDELLYLIEEDDQDEFIESYCIDEDDEYEDDQDEFIESYYIDCICVNDVKQSFLKNL